ncbi:hypothetical protein [Bradyrhizobium amphicarpaeae]|uniref:Uncharacterized protein n=1 Tax=Bradyrhizobium amphicarpaeae TaxID=1404768 RepID=A0A2U8PPW0_9BRAD|nr:hypothetical protein [Bradyrhizobium amphicarpaeae]AWL99773.1 hypothetical protein CIT40_06845 [Bradyrhizobium amphicarpaeae]
MSYDKVMLHLSLRFPRAWRARADLILLLCILLYASTGFLLKMQQIAAPDSKQGRALVGLVASLASLGAAGFWLYSISKSLRLREIIRESNHPLFATIFLGSALLLGPIIWVLYPVLKAAMFQIAISQQLGRQPQMDRDVSVAILAIFYWFIFLVVGTTFVKSLLLSSSKWVFGAWLLSAFWLYSWLIIVAVLANLASSMPGLVYIGEAMGNLVVALPFLLYSLLAFPALRDLATGVQTSAGLLSALCLPNVILTLAITLLAYEVGAHVEILNAAAVKLLPVVSLEVMLWGAVAIVLCLFVVLSELSFYFVHRLALLPRA